MTRFVVRLVLAITAAVTIGAASARAQAPFSRLHAFGALGPKGPTAPMILGSDGNFYGPSRSGGVGFGMVFRMTPAGVPTVLHVFTGGPNDGAYPSSALIQGTDGNFYGTTTAGGANTAGCFSADGCGTIFRMTPAGVITILHSFTGGSGGEVPLTPLLEASDGNFYGASSGGAANGIVYRLSPTGTFTVLHVFQNSPDGAFPNTALTEGNDGNFYGTTVYGGNGYGTIFRMTPDGTTTVLHAFAVDTDGANPTSALVLATDGNFYGTAETGDGVSTGNGTAFTITPAGVFTPLHVFGGSPGEGSRPGALIQGADGDFYGITQLGGSFTMPNQGTVFKMTAAGAVTLLHNFAGGVADGSEPTGLIEFTDGSFYGTTERGGSLCDCGIAFRVTPAGATTTLYTFTGASADGAGPRAGLIEASDGNFYGTTSDGGAAGFGTVFKMTPAGVLTVAYAFIGGADGAYPAAALIQAADGDLYGTAQSGGASNGGTVFRLTLAGTLTVVHAFSGGASDGAAPQAALLEASDGFFYGTTAAGGTSNLGTVFRMAPSGTVTVLHSFIGGYTDGGQPTAPLVEAADGNFYGAAAQGRDCAQLSPHQPPIQCGALFKVARNGAYSVLHLFSSTEGISPAGALVEGTDGNLYGLTLSSFTGSGIAFRLTPAGALTPLHTFARSATEGGTPAGGLIRLSDGTFYGTTSRGGTSDAGTIFAMDPSGLVTLLYSFAGGDNGAAPDAPPVLATSGLVYGTTPSGGPSRTGIVYGLALTLQAPSITGQPASRTVIAGQNPQFIVAASGTPAYQWQVSANHGATWSNLTNTGPYTGVTTAVLTVTHAALAASGERYRCVVANSLGTVTSGAATLTVLTRLAPGDFHGTRRSEIGVFRPANGTWYFRNPLTGAGTSVIWGEPGDLPAAADYDGDGSMDVAVFRPTTGFWYIRSTATGAMNAAQWGAAGDVPAPGDYDGDGVADVAVFRPSNGTWYIRESSTGTALSLAWGAASDQIVPGDYDGDGRTDVAVFRRSSGTWYIRYAATGAGIAIVWGGGSDIGGPGDYDGDGRTDVAIFRPSTGTWYLRHTATSAGSALVWGTDTDVPVPGDYDGDGLTDIAVFRPSTGEWFIRAAVNGAMTTLSWGGSGDVPTLVRP